MIDINYVLGIVFIMFRLTSFFMIVPIFFPTGTPKITKVLFGFMVSILIIPGVNYKSLDLINSNFQILVYCASEIINGLMLGYITNLCFNFIKMAGQYLDVHVGFAMSTLFDPMSNENVTLIQKLLYMVSVLTFLILDGHHILIRALVSSFKTVPVGHLMLTQGSVPIVLKAFINFFSLGIRISLPITFIILLVNLILGLASRSVPQLNVMILGMPIKVFIGLISIVFFLPIALKMFVSGFDQIPSIIKNLFKAAPVVMIFASSGEKTEEATPKKKNDAKKKGQVAKSKEVGLALTLLIITLIIVAFGDYIIGTLKDTLMMFLNNYLKPGITYNTLQNILILAVTRFFTIFLPVALPIMLVGVMSNLLQTGFILTGEPLKPDFKKLNPMKGFKRLFSTRTIIELIKSLAIVNVVCYVGYKFFIEKYDTILHFGEIRLEVVPHYLGKIVAQIFFKIAMIMLTIAAMDFFFQWYQHRKDLRMSKQEIKEEYKQMEGDPQVKSKIRQKQREMAMSRMMQQVPDATVVITNPTHIAIALKYVNGENEAPKVIAKGADYVAIKIKEKAKENGIPIIENRYLARLIYEKIELNGEIPADMYQAVAEILALVYKLKKQ